MCERSEHNPGSPGRTPRAKRLARHMLHSKNRATFRARPVRDGGAPRRRRVSAHRSAVGAKWAGGEAIIPVYSNGLTKLQSEAQAVDAMKILDVPRSGSYQGVTSSRNRFGQYVRTRATPVNPNSAAQGVVRARMQQNAIAWKALTQDQREGWESLGSQMSRTDALGQSYTLNGFSAYCSVNNNKLAAGDTVVSAAPAIEAPVNVVTVTLTLTSASFSVAYTATPLSTGTRLFIYASPQRNAGRSFEADYRLIAVTAAAAASPHNLLAAYTARLGAPVTGNRIFLSLVAYKGGFVSGPFNVAQIVA